MLEEKILNDYKQAMKAKDTIKTSALSFLRAELQNVAIEKRKKKLEDSDVIPVIKKQVKRHQDSIDQFTKGDRTDLAEKEKRELEILKSYLPEEISADAVKEIVKNVIAEIGAKDMKDMGKVMKETMAKTAGRADGKLVSDIVKEMLTPPK